MARITAILATLAILSGCASGLVLDRDGALAIIPYTVGRTGHIIVETTLNGQGPFEFVLDTGASISVIFDRNLAKTGIEPAAGEHVHVLGLSGTGVFPIARIGRITVGDETWENARIALLPDATPLSAQIDGILGVDFLSRYAVAYSHEDRAVRLYPREIVANRSYSGWTTISLFDMRVGSSDVTTFAFEMYIEGRRIPAMFDLGATVNLMNRGAARVLDIPVRRSRDLPNIWGVKGETTVLVELIVWRLKVEQMYWSRRNFLIGDFPVFEALDIKKNPVAIAGVNFFKGRDFIIDFSRKRLLVKVRD